MQVDASHILRQGSVDERRCCRDAEERQPRFVRPNSTSPAMPLPKTRRWRAMKDVIAYISTALTPQHATAP